MPSSPDIPPTPVTLITGAAARIGACVAKTLHASGHAVVIHYNRSEAAAGRLAETFNAARANSALTLSADFLDVDSCRQLVASATAWHGRLDVLINNASSFYPTPIGTTTTAEWDDLLGTNLKAPYFLAQAAHKTLRATQGNIVNLVDIHADRPISDHPVYCAAKAGLVALTKALARDLAPEVRVNAIAPGAILWPAQPPTGEARARALQSIPLRALGGADAIAGAVQFLITPGNYVTGHVLAVDGGRSLT